MSLRSQMLIFEARASALRLTITRLCEESGVNRVKWWRMKNDDRATAFERIERVLESHEAADAIARGTKSSFSDSSVRRGSR